MNTSHYPSLELCKKLKEIGFPDTFCFMSVEFSTGKERIEIEPFGNPNMYQNYPCPSVMEMLDIMPSQLEDGVYFELCKYGDDSEGLEYSVSYRINDIMGGEIKSYFHKSLPNALAEMILWLHDNKYLTFKNGN